MPTRVAFDNKYEVPPDYAAKWLTDFRPDDGQRFFDHEGPSKVTRQGDTFRSEGRIPKFADQKGTVVIDSPTSWHADSEFFRSGKLVGRGGVKETVRAEGSGTLHHVEVTSEPLALGMKLLFPIMGKAMMERSLRQGFARMKEQIESDFKAGKPPTG